MVFFSVFFLLSIISRSDGDAKESKTRRHQSRHNQYATRNERHDGRHG